MGNRQTVVGAFVLGGIILALGAIILFGQINPFSSVVRAVVVLQGSASGLSVGAPVTFRGVPLGSVSNIELTFYRRSFTAYIPVTLVLDPRRVHRADTKAIISIEELVRRGLRAEVNIQSLVTGQAAIELNFAPSTPAVLHPGLSKYPEIPVQQSVLQRTQKTLEQLPLQEMAENMNKSLASIRILADQLDKDMPALIVSAQRTSDQSRILVETATKTLDTLGAQLTTTLSGINTMATAATTQLNGRGADLHELLLNANTAVAQTRQTLTELRSLTAARSDQRADIEATLRDLAAAAAAMRGFASEIEREPQLLLMGRRP
jgi:paraquat-inducible protein B